MPLPAGTRCDISGCRCSQAWWHMRPLPSGHSVHHRCGGCFQGLGGTRCLTKRALSATLLGACAFIGLMAQDAASSGASIVWWHNRPSLNRHSVRQYWVHVLPGLGGVNAVPSWHSVQHVSVHIRFRGCMCFQTSWWHECLTKWAPSASVWVTRPRKYNAAFMPRQSTTSCVVLFTVHD